MYNYPFPVNYQQYPVQATQQNTQNNIIWVQGEAAAKSYAVAPNSSVALWDSESNVIYVKSADASGLPSMKVLDYTMRDSTPVRAQTGSQSDFVTKDDLVPIREELDALKAKYEEKEHERNLQADPVF